MNVDGDLGYLQEPLLKSDNSRQEGTISTWYPKQMIWLLYASFCRKATPLVPIPVTKGLGGRLAPKSAPYKSRERGILTACISQEFSSFSHSILTSLKSIALRIFHLQSIARSALDHYNYINLVHVGVSNFEFSKLRHYPFVHISAVTLHRRPS